MARKLLKYEGDTYFASLVSGQILLVRSGVVVKYFAPEVHLFRGYLPEHLAKELITAYLKHEFLHS